MKIKVVFILSKFEYLIQDDVPKYRKKRSKKKKSKEDHKHIFRKIILKRHNSYNNEIIQYSLGEICDICGKIRCTKYFPTKRVSMGYLVIDKDLDEILMTYPEYNGCEIIENEID